MMLHSADLQKLTDLKSELDRVTADMDRVQQARDCALTALEENKSSWLAQETIIQKERHELEQRLKDKDAQNSLLLDQIQALNTQLNLFQVTSDQSNVSLNQSTNDDEVKSSDKLLTVINYLRQEKDIAVSKAEIMEAEYDRLKSQFDSLQKQLNEAKQAVESERQQTEVAVVTAAKHAEVLRKVETLNAITDSNRALRQERDGMRGQIEELRGRVEQLSNELAPLQVC